jgi:hypothetical protein
MSRRRRSRRFRETPLPGALQQPTFLILPQDIGIPPSILVHSPFIFQLCGPDDALAARLYVSVVWPDGLMDLDVSETPLVLKCARVSIALMMGINCNAPRHP